MNWKKLFFTLSIIALFVACEQAEPTFNQRNGDVLTFADREWDIKIFKDITWGPGNNYFTNHPNDIWVDDEGKLHLTVTERGGKWWCSEVISKDAMGYGTYIWTVEGNPVNMDQNLVLGLFTWDDNTFQAQANSEVDIEFSKWGVATQDTTLQFGVQPINFGPYFPERDYKPKADPSLWIGTSTHAFTWTDSLITWSSWQGSEYGVGEPIASWSFGLNNPARVKNEGGNSSNPIIIPAPGNTTNARMNFWLVNGIEGPVSQARHELIISNFEYRPL